MCTITFLPTGAGSYLLASNRDEQKSRPSSTEPLQHNVSGIQCVWPVDRQAGGTWIAANETGAAFALMNDYQSRQHASGSDTSSRGVIIPEIADCSSPDQVAERFADSDPLKHLSFQPFRLLMADSRNGVTMWHFDGQALQRSHQGYGAGIWVSAGKEESKIRNGRRQLFEDFLGRSYKNNLGRIMDLHTTQNGLKQPDDINEGNPDLFGFSMELEHVRTVSSTIVEFVPDNVAGKRKSGSLKMHFMPGRPDPQKKWQTRVLD
ncbi:NRDE family protein [Natronogracilivirga saccharolytica]|uniref:NRDE family protein n=1 Tax=Natronogracilivirga saccharolytica TaxID=2812953 RepID=A0A8J7UU71_9BACT|nr:NRDE family protein [Natronogracilivirga saccharolytica]MBP3191192.1 NRDE family protein [Natronogracilivirga saccharolytica]